MKYLLNAFSLQMIEDIAPCDISIREVFNPDLSELKSCIGHIDTANMLGVDYNRQNVSLKKGDFAIVAQVVGADCLKVVLNYLKVLNSNSIKLK